MPPFISLPMTSDPDYEERLKYDDDANEDDEIPRALVALA